MHTISDLISKAKELSTFREDENNWLMMLDVLTSIRDALSSKQDALLVVGSLHSFMECTMCSDRSRLCGASMELLSRCLDYAEIGLGMFFNPLIRLCNRPSRVFSTRASSLFVRMCGQDDMTRHLNNVGIGFKSLNKNVRLAVIKGLFEFFRSLYVGRIPRFNWVIRRSSELDDLKQIVEKAKVDPSCEVRKEARLCDEFLRSDPMKDSVMSPAKKLILDGKLITKPNLQHSMSRKEKRISQPAGENIPTRSDPAAPLNCSSSGAVNGSAVDSISDAREGLHRYSAADRKGRTVPNRRGERSAAHKDSRAQIPLKKFVSKAEDVLTPKTLSKYISDYKKSAFLNMYKERSARSVAGKAKMISPVRTCGRQSPAQDNGKKAAISRHINLDEFQKMHIAESGGGFSPPAMRGSSRAGEFENKTERKDERGNELTRSEGCDGVESLTNIKLSDIKIEEIRLNGVELFKNASFISRKSSNSSQSPNSNAQVPAVDGSCGAMRVRGAPDISMDTHDPVAIQHPTARQIGNGDAVDVQDVPVGHATEMCRPDDRKNDAIGGPPSTPPLHAADVSDAEAGNDGVCYELDGKEQLPSTCVRLSGEFDEIQSDTTSGVNVSNDITVEGEIADAFVGDKILSAQIMDQSTRRSNVSDGCADADDAQPEHQIWKVEGRRETSTDECGANDATIAKNVPSQMEDPFVEDAHNSHGSECEDPPISLEPQAKPDVEEINGGSSFKVCDSAQPPCQVDGQKERVDSHAFIGKGEGEKRDSDAVAVVQHVGTSSSKDSRVDNSVTPESVAKCESLIRRRVVAEDERFPVRRGQVSTVVGSSVARASLSPKTKVFEELREYSRGSITSDESSPVRGGSIVFDDNAHISNGVVCEGNGLNPRMRNIRTNEEGEKPASDDSVDCSFNNSMSIGTDETYGPIYFNRVESAPITDGNNKENTPNARLYSNTDTVYLKDVGALASSSHNSDGNLSYNLSRISVNDKDGQPDDKANDSFRG